MTAVLENASQQDVLRTVRICGVHQPIAVVVHQIAAVGLGGLQ